MSTLLLILASICGLLAMFFNLTNAVWLWGAVGGFLAVFAFPIMFIVVPIGVLMRGEIPVYWLLLPTMGFLLWLAHQIGNE